MDEAAIEERLAAFVAGELDDEERGRVQAYLDAHPQWLAVVAALAPSWSEGSDADGSAPTLRRIRAAERTRLAPGTRLGPYTLRTEIGRGAMGTVYEAYDPRLRREIAIKVLSPREGVGAALAEARAAVQVRHPNVVEVFDTGHASGRAFIAMELLRGVDLSAWRRTRPRRIDEVLHVFVDAGHGLAAAHAKGLVHRDFKPANVFVTDAGRIVVLDFGLAADVPPDDDASEGTAVGTQAYMAPELRAGRKWDARVDQFSFGVALAEALDGELPAASALAGRPLGIAPAVGRVPVHVRAALRRATSPDPSERFADVDAMLAALTHRRASRWPYAIAVMGVGLGAVTFGGDPCAEVGTEIDASWNRDAATTVRRRYTKIATVDDRVAQLDAYAADWTRMRRQQCRAGEQTSPGARECVTRARHAVDAVVEVLLGDDDDPRALEAIDTLPELARCDSTQRGAGLDAQTEELIARVDALRAGGRTADAIRTGRSLMSRLQRAAVDPELAARAHRAYGLALRDATQYQEARQALVTARDLAMEASDDRLVADAYADLAWLVGYLLSRHDEGRDLVRHATAWAQRVGDPPQLQMHRHRTAGWIELDAGDAVAAIPWFEQSLAAIVGQTPTDLEDRAMTLNGLGAAKTTAGDIEGGLSALQQAADVLASLRGDDHVTVATVRNNIAAGRRAQGDLRGAIALFEHNLEIFERVQGPTSVAAAQTRINLAVAHLDFGDFALVLRYANDALTALQAGLEPGHPLIAKAHTLRGDARLQLGDHEGALEDLNVALELELHSLGPAHPSVGLALTDLGSVYYELVRPGEAIAHHRRALEVLEPALGADHASLAIVWTNLALAHIMADDYASARTALEQAVDIGGPQSIASARTHLGRVLLHDGEVQAAIALLEQALTDHAAVDADPVHVAQTQVALARALVSIDPARSRDLIDTALPVLDANDAADTAADARDTLSLLP